MSGNRHTYPAEVKLRTTRAQKDAVARLAPQFGGDMGAVWREAMDRFLGSLSDYERRVERVEKTLTDQRYDVARLRAMFGAYLAVTLDPKTSDAVVSRADSIMHEVLNGSADRSA